MTKSCRANPCAYALFRMHCRKCEEADCEDADCDEAHLGHSLKSKRAGSGTKRTTGQLSLQQHPSEMRMKKILMMTTCLLLAGPAAAQSVGEKSGLNSLIGVSPSTPDFVKEVAISDMFEIQSSQLVLQKAVDDSATKAFAERMTADHEKTSSELKAMVESGKVKANLPSQLDSAHQSKLDKLKSLNGADFLKQYHSDQDAGHKDAVSLFQRYAKGGDDPALKDWAAKTLPTLDEHLKSAENLDK
jgi:putative membrane protein